jgi:hypothetical protein
MECVLRDEAVSWVVEITMDEEGVEEIAILVKEIMTEEAEDLEGANLSVGEETI